MLKSGCIFIPAWMVCCLIGAYLYGSIGCNLTISFAVGGVLASAIIGLIPLVRSAWKNG